MNLGEFVYYTKCLNEKTESEKLLMIYRYQDFLNTPLTLGMFVPCIYENEPIGEPRNWTERQEKNKTNSYHLCHTCDLYQQALDRVIFVGFKITENVLTIPKTSCDLFTKSKQTGWGLDVIGINTIADLADEFLEIEITEKVEKLWEK